MIKKKKIFVDKDGNFVKKYIFVNMGDYVGYASRQWYDSVPDCFRLMFCDRFQNDKIVMHIEALVDSSDEYSRIMVDKYDCFRRVILIDKGMILEDSVNKLSDNGFGDEVIKNFKSNNNFSKVKLRDYLQEDDILETNDFVLEFLDTNEKFKNEFKGKKR